MLSAQEGSPCWRSASPSCSSSRWPPCRVRSPPARSGGSTRAVARSPPARAVRYDFRVGWITESAEEIAARAERELEALVGVSSPSGDAPGAEEVFAITQALLPARASVERVPCSSPDHAPDLVARLNGTGNGRVLLVGHVDTVVSHDEHRPLVREQDRLVGSGTIDMKSGDVLAVGVLQALAGRPDAFDEVALLLVCDEEWRTAPFGHVDRFEGFDAVLCFEAGQTTPAGEEAVVVRRKAAGTLHVRATGVSAHSGSAPDRGRNALLALA